MIYRKSIIFLLIFSTFLWQDSVLACGPFFDTPDFSFTLHPDFPLSKFASGKIGVLKTTMARSYLVAAWRYFNAVPLSAEEQKGFVTLWEQRLDNGSTDSDRAVKSWTELRKTLGVKPAEGEIYPERSFNGKDSFFTYINCPNTAFSSAVQTAQLVSKEFGAGSKEVKDWAVAQDNVFCNCNGGFDDKARIPGQIDASLNKKLKPFRDYQIASANFYAGKYDLAKEEFESIGKDPDSPFKDLGAYLALRASVRKAVVAEKTDLNLLSQIETQIRTLLNDKSKASVHTGLEDLLAFIRFKVDQKNRFVELTQLLSTGKDADHVLNNLCDYTFIFDNILGETDGGGGGDAKAQDKAKLEGQKFAQGAGDLSDWISSFQKDEPDASKHAATMWHSTHKLAWLVASLAMVDEKSPECAKLIDDARKIAKSSPAYLQLQYEIAVQLAAQDKDAEAKKTIDAILQDKSLDMGPSSRNAFIEQRLFLCKDFPEFMQFALQRPASIDDGSSGTEGPNDYDKVEKSNNYPSHDPAFSLATAKFMNFSVPLNVLSPLQANNSLPKKLKADVLQSLWVRAFLLDDTKSLSAVSPALKQAIPSLEPLISAYDKANNADEKKFAAALMILRNPGMRPLITWGYGRRTELNKIDDYQDNWWEVEELLPPPKDSADQDALSYGACLTAQQKSAALAENKKIANLGVAPAALAKFALDFVQKSPQDPRIPEALSLAVKATHFGQRNAATSKLSKECFTVLHNKYPKSPWAAKTKYFY